MECLIKIKVNQQCFPELIQVFFLFQFEILFCVQDERDSAVAVVRQLMQNYPKVNARLFTGKAYYTLFSMSVGNLKIKHHCKLTEKGQSFYMHIETLYCLEKHAFYK